MVGIDQFFKGQRNAKKSGATQNANVKRARQEPVENNASNPINLDDSDSDIPQAATAASPKVAKPDESLEILEEEPKPRKRQRTAQPAKKTPTAPSSRATKSAGSNTSAAGSAEKLAFVGNSIR